MEGAWTSDRMGEVDVEEALNLIRKQREHGSLPKHKSPHLMQLMVQPETLSPKFDEHCSFNVQEAKRHLEQQSSQRNTERRFQHDLSVASAPQLPTHLQPTPIMRAVPAMSKLRSLGIPKTRYYLPASEARLQSAVHTNPTALPRIGKPGRVTTHS
eukprot:NODE_3588_length_940_cov_22.093481_g3436_i0.p1 GENE.NODE_3588_length_940_cov_22.093481_g3436_i0~~NODE_3588_length_940_cov_22.093481_g3436_i0.p1  ORF type:complete len:156 (+),score=26.66 NODE_3588_length_940_cov_22.093481_g3436_i0:381-848(+)